MYSETQDPTGNDHPKILSYVNYNIYLGMNFGNSYTLQNNYRLNYWLNLIGENLEDNNVIRMVPGYFTGSLQGYTANGTPVDATSGDAVKWQYDTPIEVYQSDTNDHLNKEEPDKVGPVVWCSDATALYDDSNKPSMTDGYFNTVHSWYQQDQSAASVFPAAYGSYIGLNPFLGWSTTADTDWYVPSITELVGVWLAAGAVYSTMSPRYWSSTGVKRDGIATYNVYTLTNDGEIALTDPTDGHTYARAVRHYTLDNSPNPKQP